MNANKKKNIFSFHLNVDKFNPATPEEKARQDLMREQVSFFKDGIRRLMKNKIAMVCFFVIVFIILVAVFVPMFYPYSYSEQLGVQPGRPVDASYSNLKPFQYGATEKERIASGERVFPHIFGTDERGRDYFIRVIYG
ncbi:MAG: ABC transporter permease, partial [Bacilli bacterium]